MKIKRSELKSLIEGYVLSEQVFDLPRADANFSAPVKQGSKDSYEEGDWETYVSSYEFEEAFEKGLKDMSKAALDGIESYLENPDIAMVEAIALLVIPLFFPGTHAVTIPIELGLVVTRVFWPYIRILLEGGSLDSAMDDLLKDIEDNLDDIEKFLNEVDPEGRPEGMTSMNESRLVKWSTGRLDEVGRPGSIKPEVIESTGVEAALEWIQNGTGFFIVAGVVCSIFMLKIFAPTINNVLAAPAKALGEAIVKYFPILMRKFPGAFRWIISKFRGVADKLRNAIKSMRERRKLKVIKQKNLPDSFDNFDGKIIDITPSPKTQLPKKDIFD